MSIHSDHKALLFVGAIAVLGAGVRIARANGVNSAIVAQPALDHQMQAADSSKRAVVAKRQSKKKAAHPTSQTSAQASQASEAAKAAQQNSRGHFNGRLDLDVATASQIDSLPGVGPSLAKRIAADRMARGPFLGIAALKRVKGVSAKVIARLDSLVAFSGTITSGSAADTIILPKTKAPQRGAASPPPPELSRE